MADSSETAVDEVAKAARTTMPAGTTGVVAYGGYVQMGEASPALQGRQKWLTYTNAQNVAVVATGIRYFGNLLAGTEWHAEPNAAGGPDADRGVEIIEQGMLRAPLPQSWPLVVRKAAMYKFLGFTLHATGIARRDDGMVVYSDIQHRPQHTIEKWNRPDEQSAFEQVEQRSPETGKMFPIDLDECLYCVDNLMGDGPEGVGLLRHVIELVRRLGLFEGLEGSGYFQEIAGTPIARAPLEELAAIAKSGDAAAIQKAISDATANIKALVANRIHTPEKQLWAMLDSATYRGSDPNTVSQIQKWGIEILKGAQRGMGDLNQTIQRVGLEIARVLGIEFALVGGGDSAGSYGMHADKTSMFASMLQTTLTEIAQFATQQLARRLIALNGLDPDKCTPTLVAAPISTDAIETVTAALANIAKAGLMPDDPAIPVLRKRMHIPMYDLDEVDAKSMLGGSKPRPKATPAKPTSEPAKAKDMKVVDDKAKAKADKPTKEPL